MLLNDKAHFHISGFVNKRNMQYGVAVNLAELHKQQSYSPEVTVWWTAGKSGTVRLVYLENSNGGTVRVPAERHIAVLQKGLLPQLPALRMHSNLYWQQDTATAHSDGVWKWFTISPVGLFPLFWTSLGLHGPDVPGFLPMEIIEITLIEKSPTHNRGDKA
jgi:hypothetical protein